LRKYCEKNADGLPNELESWPKNAPHPFKNMKEMKLRFREECVPYVLGDAKNNDNQMSSFCSRIKPIHRIIWSILTKDRANGKHGGKLAWIF